jgi:hypothetical protein
MNLDQFTVAVQDSALAEWMRYTPRAMPLVEAVHVLAAVTVFGTLTLVDLRLLGLAGTRKAFSWIAGQVLPITWIAFGVAMVTGVLMFSTSARIYAANLAFELKMLALLGAGLNMVCFRAVVQRRIVAWDPGQPPRAARFAGAISLLLWASVVLLGRWIGFTKGYDFTLPADFEFPARD